MTPLVTPFPLHHLSHHHQSHHLSHDWHLQYITCHTNHHHSCHLSHHCNSDDTFPLNHLSHHCHFITSHLTVTYSTSLVTSTIITPVTCHTTATQMTTFSLHHVSHHCYSHDNTPHSSLVTQLPLHHLSHNHHSYYLSHHCHSHDTTCHTISTSSLVTSSSVISLVTALSPTEHHSSHQPSLSLVTPFPLHHLSHHSHFITCLRHTISTSSLVKSSSIISLVT